MNPDMHILLIPSWYATAKKPTSGSFFRDQAVALATRGLKVGLIYPETVYTGKFATLFSSAGDVKITDDEGVSVYTQPRYFWRRGSSSRHAARILAGGLKLFESYVADQGLPDLIHVHSALYAGPIAVAIKKRYGIPYVLTEHSSAYARRRVRKNKMNIAQKVVDSAEAHIAVSHPFAQLLSDFFSNSFWKVIPNILDQRFIESGIDFPTLDRKSRPFKFLNVCYFSKNKGLDKLINAFAEVAVTHTNVHLTLAGDGELRPFLEEQVDSLGLSDRVNFTGMLSRQEVFEAMQACDCFVLSSDYETFGVVLIEALALGKPVVATRCGGPEDIVNDENGSLIPVGDIKSLANAMINIIENKSNYNSVNIREKCLDLYGPANVSSQLAKEYEEILSK